MTQVKLNKGMIQRRIRSQIDQGHELTELFADAGQINSYEALLEGQRNIENWSARNSELLGSIFDDLSIRAEYKNLDVPMVNEDQSRLEYSRTIRAGLVQRVEWLEALINRIDEFPESEKTPTGRWGR